MKVSKLLTILPLGVLAVAFVSCKNSDRDFPDFDGGTTAYFSYQYPIRTLILGSVETYDNTSDNEHRFTIYGTFGGSYEGRNIKIDVNIDESLTKNLYFEDGTEVKPMPQDYYTVSGNVLDYGGGFRGGVEIQLNDKFFNDPLSVKNTYVIPMVMGENFSGVDRINRGTPVIEGSSPLRQDQSKWSSLPKDYTLFCVNYINKYTATYLRRGVDEFDKMKFKTMTETVTSDDMCIAVHATAKHEQVWDNQFFIDVVTPFADGDEYTLTMDVKATKAAKSSTQIHEAPGTYKDGLGEINFTTDWNTITVTGKISGNKVGGHSIAFNLNELADSNDYYFDNISLVVNAVEAITNPRCDNVENPHFFSQIYGGSVSPSSFEKNGDKKQTDVNKYIVSDGYADTTAYRHTAFIERDEVVYTTSLSKNQVLLPISTTEVEGKNSPCELILTFDENGNCTIESNTAGCTATGSGHYSEGTAIKAWGDKDRDELILEYSLVFDKDDVHYATKDTLVWRDRGTFASIRSFKPVYKEN